MTTLAEASQHYFTPKDLKSWRDRNRLSIKYAAVLCGIGHQTYSEIERGMRKGAGPAHHLMAVCVGYDLVKHGSSPLLFKARALMEAIDKMRPNAAARQ